MNLILFLCKFTIGIRDSLINHTSRVKDTNSAEIIRFLQSGDEKAFETVYRLYSNNLYIVARSYINDDFVAEEIVQKVFIRLWDKREQLNITSNLNGYLFMMVKNKCLDHLRKPRKIISFEDKVGQDETDINFNALQDDGVSRLIESELEQSIYKAIDFLPDACKAVFLKTKIDGLKYREAANELNISVKTVESHMNKALKHMRVYLREFLSVFL